MDPAFLRLLSISVKKVSYLPMQIVLRRGDITKEMFFIVNGEIEVMHVFIINVANLDSSTL